MTGLPTFSIVVPTYRRPERLASCLEALSRIDYPHDRFEVIIVDDGGEPPEVGQMAAARAAINVMLLSQPHAGPATARNTGAGRARGSYLAFTDDDCMPDPGWLRAMAARVVDAPDYAIGGRTINALPDNPYSATTQVLVDYLYEWCVKHGSTVFFAANNLVVPTGLFRARGAFAPTFTLAAGEDREFCYRWGRSGGRFTYAPEAIVHHRHSLNLGSFWHQHFTYGRGAFHFHRIVANSEGGRPAPAPLSFYMKLVAHPFRRTRGTRRLSYPALLLLAQAATVMGYWRERLRE